MIDVTERLEEFLKLDQRVVSLSLEDMCSDALTEIQKLREMLQWCAEQTWEGGDIDWGDFRDAMMEHGLLVEVEADEDFKAEWDSGKMYVLAWSELAK